MFQKRNSRLILVFTLMGGAFALFQNFEKSKAPTVARALASVNIKGDISGDRQADLLVSNKDGSVGIALSNGEKFGRLQIWKTDVEEDFEVFFADVTGLGKPDLILRNKKSGNIDVYLTSSKDFVKSEPGPRETHWATGIKQGSDIFFADVDGDGRIDLILRNKTSGDVDVRLSTGQRFAPSQKWIQGLWSKYEIYFADVNGDGRQDLVTRFVDEGPHDGDINVSFSSGTDFKYSQTPWSKGFKKSKYELYFADVTGDGFADMIGRQKNNGDLDVFRANGTKFTYTTLWSNGWGEDFALLFKDFNGDGRVDLVAKNKEGEIFTAPSTGGVFLKPKKVSMGIHADSTIY